MATLSIEKTLRAFGVSTHNNSEAGTRHESGILSRFLSAARVWADKYGENKYNETDWRAFRF